MDGIKEESVTALFNLDIQVQQNPIVEEAPDGAIPGMLFGPNAPTQQAAAAQQAALQQQQAAAAAAQQQAVAAAAQQQAAAQRQATRRPQPPVAPEAAAPVPAAFGGTGPGGAKRPADAGSPAAKPAGPGSAGSRSGNKRGRHAADGRGHATAAGRGEAATHSSAEEPADEVPSGPTLPASFEPRRPRQLQYSAPSDSGGVEVKKAGTDPFANVGRNDPCPCGSGRKYKRCHGDPTRPA
jgi:preprotein translocase subunit SecA